MTTNLHFISLDTVGGVEVLFCELIKHFPRPSDINCIAMYSKVIHDFFKAPVSDHVHSKESIKYFGRLKLPKWPPVLRMWNHQRILETIDPDVLLFWNTIDGAGYIGAKPFPRHARVIVVDQGTSWYRTKYLPASQRLLSRTSLSLCCSFASKRMMELHQHYTGETKVIHNPLRANFPLPLIPKGIPQNRRVRLGVAGRFVHVKGIPLAIHTVKILKHRGLDVELHIAGTGRYEAAYKKIVEQLGIEKAVVFLGVVKDMPRFFQDIDIFLCPSIREPFGIVAIEAMGSGCPLISARIDGLAEVVEPGKTGFSLAPSLPIRDYLQLGGGISGLPEVVYYPDLDDIGPPAVIDPDAMADAVQKLLADDARYKEMSRNCVELTRQKFSFDDYLHKIASVLGAHASF